MTIWQIATGDTGRNYSSIFFDHDVMILGGSWLGDAQLHCYNDKRANSEGNQINNFTFSPSPGDRVLMRFGKQVIGVGEIPPDSNGGYSFEEAFRCVYGWELCHTRRVKWADNLDVSELEHVFKKMKQKPSFTAIHEKHIVDIVTKIDSSHFKRNLKELPSLNTKRYTQEELGIELFQSGISNKNIQDILSALEQADRLCTWYQSESSGRYPTENEVISHIVLPLLLGLGWSHQQLAVEWNRVDMAFFSKAPTDASNCIMILEAKGLGAGLGDVLQQPVDYVDRLNLDKVDNILITDGANLFVYEKESNNNWGDEPVAYLSVQHLLKEYILPKNTNPVSTLVQLKPGLK